MLEEVSEKVKEVYLEAFNGAATLHFSVWNVGEVLGALDTYYRRNRLERRLQGRPRIIHRRNGEAAEAGCSQGCSCEIKASCGVLAARREISHL